jgi:NAD(P)-dependent dehydrogenase (short-subunit alcohol dehydrogenase family)
MPDRVAIVTGASRGLGKGIATGLGAAGWTVYVTGRSLGTPTESLGGTIEETAALVSARGGTGVAIACDHRHDDEVAAVFARVESDHGRLDLLVNNAFLFAPSFFSTAPFWERPLDEWDMVDVGLRSHYVAAVFAARLMAPAGRGLIVNVSSFSGRFGGGPVAYDVGKAGVERLNRATAADLARVGITTVCFWPGLIRTERTVANFTADPAVLGGAFTLDDAETPEFSGRVIAALADDADVARFHGTTVVGAELAAEVYGITDLDGSQPASLRRVYGGGPEEVGRQ